MRDNYGATGSVKTNTTGMQSVACASSPSPPLWLCPVPAHPWRCRCCPRCPGPRGRLAPSCCAAWLAARWSPPAGSSAPAHTAAPAAICGCESPLSPGNRGKPGGKEGRCQPGACHRRNAIPVSLGLQTVRPWLSEPKPETPQRWRQCRRGPWGQGAPAGLTQTGMPPDPKQPPPTLLLQARRSQAGRWVTTTERGDTRAGSHSPCPRPRAPLSPARAHRHAGGAPNN